MLDRACTRRGLLMFFGWKRPVFGLAVILVSTMQVSAGLPASPAERSKLIGQPLALVAEPGSISLTSPRATQQIVITGKYADGSVRDLTLFSDMASESTSIAS